MISDSLFKCRLELKPKPICQIKYRIDIDWRQIHISLELGLSSDFREGMAKNRWNETFKYCWKAEDVGDLKCSCRDRAQYLTSLGVRTVRVSYWCRRGIYTSIRVHILGTAAVLAVHNWGEADSMCWCQCNARILFYLASLNHRVHTAVLHVFKGSCRCYGTVYPWRSMYNVQNR